MKIIVIIITALCLQSSSFAQTRYFSKDGKISFYSKAPMENIEAHNNKAVSVIDLSSGAMEFSVLMKGFEFEKAKMQEHFNENYVESDKYPKASYVGKIENLSSLKIKQDGSYPVKITGKLTMHGVTKDQSAEAVITVKGGNISAVSDLTITLQDYNVQIPSLVAEKISKTVKITVTVPSYKPM
jgi:polyisoprenoid-binding protein YceI